MAKANWELIKTEYLTTHITYQELCEKHGISMNTLTKRAAKEKWKNGKKATSERIAKKTQKKVADKVATKTAKKINLIDDSLDRLLKIINKSVQDAEQFNKHLVKLRSSDQDGSMEELVVKKNEVIDTKRLESMVRSLETATKLHRLINNVLDEPVRQKLEIEKERLAIDKDKAGFNDDEDSDTGVVYLPDVDMSLEGEVDE